MAGQKVPKPNREAAGRGTELERRRGALHPENEVRNGLSVHVKEDTPARGSEPAPLCHL